jgi:polysaccharide chain length determinant protein (PEP-CTERM system associated)
MSLLDTYESSAPAAPQRSVAEYLEIPLRHPWLVIVPFVVITAAAYAATKLVPKKYKSSTFILVESEQVPAAVVPKMTSQMDEARRMTIMKQEVLSQSRLEEVIKETNPYPFPGQSMNTMVDWLRINADISLRGPDSFNVEFIHTDPEKAAEVVNRIATLFIDETNRARAQQVAEAYSFLDTEASRARKELEAKEEAVRRYREAHMGSLPEQSMSNLATMQRLQQQLQAEGEELRAATDRQADLEKQLAEARAGGTVTELQTGPEKEISQLRSQLSDLRSRYTDAHPDIQRLLARLSALEASVPTESKSPAPNGGASRIVTTMELRVEKARREVAVLQDKKAELERQIAALQARLDATPRVEQELTTISRDFGNIKENYLSLVNKRADAQMAAKLEERWKGQRFRILDPAHVPYAPFFPNEVLFLAAGVVLGLMVGLGLAVTAELLDHSVKNVADVEAAVPYPLLAAVPYIRPGRAAKARKPRKPPKPRLEQQSSLLRL